jgi:hypothetical protein
MPHGAWAQRAQELADAARGHTARAKAAAERHERLARDPATQHAAEHVRVAAMYRDAEALYERTAALQTLHADHERRAAELLVDSAPASRWPPAERPHEVVGAGDQHAVLAHRQTLADNRDEAAEAREHAVDARERAADAREQQLDARERAADAREQQLDARERAADAREQQLGAREAQLDERERRLEVDVGHDDGIAEDREGPARSTETVSRAAGGGPQPVTPSAERHEHAAGTHKRAGERHEQAASFWESRAEPERAALERRAAELELQLAELERDEAALLRARDPT